MKLKCIFKHKPSKPGHYLDSDADYQYKYKCERCGVLLGWPHMTDKKLKRDFPPPPLPRHIGDYKYEKR